jgi:UDP-glucose 4-epimerase
MKVLVVGGLGYVGLWITGYLIEKGFNVSILSRRESIYAKDKGYRVLTADITQPLSLAAALDGQVFDVVVHLASADPNSGDSYLDQCLYVDIAGTKNLLETIPTTQLKHFIYFSTFHVYGRMEGEITEDIQPQPTSYYGLVHLCAEHFVEMISRLRGFSYSILRLTNSYGCPQDLSTNKWSLAINDFARYAVKNRAILIRSACEVRRDFIWLGTVCEVVAKLVNNEVSLQYPVNLSAEESFTLLEIAEFVQSAYQSYFGAEIPIQVQNQENSTPSSMLHVSSKRLKEVIPYTASRKIVEECHKVFYHFDQRGP